MKFVQETGEKCGENLAKNFADFRPSISRENARKKLHEKSSTFSPLRQKSFSLLQLWEVGAPNGHEDFFLIGGGKILIK